MCFLRVPVHENVACNQPRDGVQLLRMNHFEQFVQVAFLSLNAVLLVVLEITLVLQLEVVHLCILFSLVLLQEVHE